MFAEEAATCHDGVMKRSGDYPEKILDPGEEILIHERPHWISLARPTLLTILTVMLAMLLVGLSDALQEGVLRDILQAALILVMVAILLVWVVVPVLHWLGSSIVVTSNRVVFRQGVFRKETFSVSLAWLQAVDVEQSLLGRMLHYGTVHISSYELGGLQFDRVPHPHDLESFVRSGSAELQHTGAYPQRAYYAPAEGYPAYPPVGAGYAPMPPLATYQSPAQNPLQPPLQPPTGAPYRPSYAGRGNTADYGGGAQKPPRRRRLFRR